MKQEIFQKRRQIFLQQIAKESEHAMAVLFSAPSAIRNNDSHYDYRTCSYFYHLTGLIEENAAAIFMPKSDKPYRLFVMPKNPEAELWDGKRYGVEGAKKIFGADESFPIEEFDAQFKSLLKTVDTLYYPLGLHAKHDQKILEILRLHTPNPRAGEKKFRQLKKAQEILAPLRIIKDEAELELLRRNCRNSALAHRKAMEHTKPGLYEYQVEAEIEHAFRFGGAEDLAYGSIVAGGNNATVLHYKTNRDLLQEGSLLLIDAGGEMGLYASDITRTFPINGKFTKAQKELYALVLKSQKAAIAAVKPGVRFHDIHKITVEVLVDGLLALGLLQGKLEDIVKDRKLYSAFYPHNTSHWMGLDVHDVGDYYLENGESAPLQIGNVLTIEPGLYISEDRTDVPAEYRGIGIRIEDDVFVTAEACEVLTKDAPKEMEEIEAIVGRAFA